MNDLKSLPDKVLEEVLFKAMAAIKTMMENDIPFTSIQQATKDLEPIEYEIQIRYNKKKNYGKKEENVEDPVITQNQ